MNNNITFSSLAYDYFLDVCGTLQVKFFKRIFFSVVQISFEKYISELP